MDSLSLADQEDPPNSRIDLSNPKNKPRNSYSFSVLLSNPDWVVTVSDDQPWEANATNLGDYGPVLLIMCA